MYREQEHAFGNTFFAFGNTLVIHLCQNCIQDARKADVCRCTRTLRRKTFYTHVYVFNPFVINNLHEAKYR